MKKLNFYIYFVMFRQNVATICFWFVGLHYQLSYNPKSTYSHDVDIDAKLLITLPNKIYTSISASTNQNNVFVDLFVNLKILQQRCKRIFNGSQRQCFGGVFKSMMMLKLATCNTL